ncbi:MAG: alanine racemase [Bacteroidia bacterium]
MLEISRLTEPILLIDIDKLKNNVRGFQKKCKANELALLPHFKTHQSATIGQIIKEQGINGITVSSIKMAKYFAQNGFERIHLAMVPIQNQREVLNSLANHVELSINVSCKEHLKAIEGLKIKVLIDIDPAYGRTGIDINDIDKIRSFYQIINENKALSFFGLYIHNGATYKGLNEINQLHEDTLHKLGLVKKEIGKELNVFFGDTPGCSMAINFKGITHITAGNFVFYDLMQASFGSCRESEIAICMACPIIEKHESNNELVIHGGAVHFSKDSILNSKGTTIYGKMVHLSNKSWGTSVKDCELTSVSQEHGIIKVNNAVFEQYKVGDIVGVLPVHSCLTANCMRQFISFDGTSYAAINR